MHRVELKANYATSNRTYYWVPNAPCGVESKPCQCLLKFVCFLFLMHRVELKVMNLRNEEIEQSSS